MSEVAVIGAGYVGITSAACLARFGHDVVCADIDADKIEKLQRGEIPILEEGLPALVAEGLASGRLRFVVGAAAAVRDAEFIFLCVPTPHGEGGAADLSVVQAVAREIAAELRPGAIVVNKSTMPVGSTRMVARELAYKAAYAIRVGDLESNPDEEELSEILVEALGLGEIAVDLESEVNEALITT